jgi:hypothetical protein
LRRSPPAAIVLGSLETVGVQGTRREFVHGFHNESSEPASMLIVFAPGAPREAYFEALAEKGAGRRFSDEEWKDLCRRHDNYCL